MHRIALALAAATLTAPAVASAQDAAETCILSSVETRVGGRKPNTFEMKLDCGKTPTEAQVWLIGAVYNTMNTADAVGVVLGQGYDVVGQSWRESFTGRQILGIYTFAKPVTPVPDPPPAPVLTPERDQVLEDMEIDDAVDDELLSPDEEPPGEDMDF